MVTRILKLLNREFGGLHKAALLLAFSAIASSFLGLFRDRLLASNFGAGRTLDIYYASFKIPDLLYTALLALVSVTVFIPMFLDKNSRSQEESKDFFNQVFTLFIVCFIALCLLLFLVMPLLAPILAPGFNLEEKRQLVFLARIMLLSPFFLGLSTIFSGVIQSFRKFFIYALSPLVYNIGIIIGITLFFPIFGLKGIVFGVILGAFFHMAVQMPTLVGLKSIPSLTTKINKADIKKVVFSSFPRTVGLTTNQLILFIITSMSSLLVPGSIAIFNFSYALQMVPLTIIGMSFSVAAFPTMAKLFIGQEKEKFLDYTYSAARQIVFWSLPVMVLFVVLRAQIVRVILGAGHFSWNDTRLTAAAVAVFSISVLAQSLVMLFTRAYFATGRTKKPIFINVFTSLLIIVFIYLITAVFNLFPGVEHFYKSSLRVLDIKDTAVLIFPLAFSLNNIINVIWLYFAFKKDVGGGPHSMRKMFYQVSTASLLMGFVSYSMLNMLDKIFDLATFIGIFMQGAVSGVVGLFVWFLVLKIFKNKELEEITYSLKNKFWKEEAIISDPENLP